LITTQIGRIMLINPNLSEAYYTVRLVVHVSNTNSLKSFYVTYFNFVIIVWNNFCGFYPRVERYLLYKRKFFGIMFGA